MTTVFSRIPNRWLVVALALVVQAFTVGTFTYSFTFWVEPWATTFGVGKPEVMSTASVRIYAVAAASFLLARYLDRLSPRLLVSIGMIAYAASVLAVAAAPSLSVIMGAYVVLVPLAMVLAGPVGAITIVSKAFKENRALAMAIATMGTSIGGTIIPNLVAAMLESAGWREAHLVLGLASLAVLPLVWLILRTPAASKPASAAGGDIRKPSVTTAAMLQTRNFWICVVTFFATFVAFVAVQFNIAPFAADLGIGLTHAALLVTLFTVSMLPGRLIVGFAADRVDKRFVFLGIATAIAVGLICLALHPELPLIEAGLVTMGIGVGGLIPLKGAILTDTFGVSNVGRALGVSSPFISLYGVAPAGAAWLRETTGSYSSVFMICLVLLLATAPLIMLVRPQPT